MAPLPPTQRHMEALMADKTIKCTILRDTWDAEGNRHVAGSVVDISAEAAMDGVENGTLARVKNKATKD